MINCNHNILLVIAENIGNSNDFEETINGFSMVLIASIGFKMVFNGQFGHWLNDEIFRLDCQIKNYFSTLLTF